MLKILFKVHSRTSPTTPTLSFCAVVLTAACALLGFTAEADAGTLRGRVTLSGGSTAAVQESSFDPYPGTLGSLPHAGGHDRSATPRDVVIYLTGGTSLERGSRSTSRPNLYQIDQSFEPHVLGVTTGTTVEFPNKDLIFHNVFSYSRTKRFDLGYYGKGKSKSVVFDKPGLVKVFCDIHSNMSAFILVVDTPHVTQPQADGQYEIADVADGDYTLHIWHPTRGSRTQTVSIRGGTTDFDINL
jgi:plastocyanin